MLLHLTLAAAPGHRLESGGAHWSRREVVMEIGESDGGGDAAARLAERYGPGSFSIGGSPLADLRPGLPPFVSGAVIVCSPRRQGAPEACAASPASPASLLLVVSSGPDAGGISVLQRGTYRIGRGSSGAEAGSGRRIGIADPALSRDHALLVVGTDSVEVRDLGSANGTRVDGKRVRAAVVDTGSLVQFGYSSCRLAVPSEIPEPEPLTDDPWKPQAVQINEHGRKAGLLLIGALLPLILGVVLALATGMWMFLAFSAISAVTALVGAAGGRRRHREENAAIAKAVHQDARVRRLAAPDLGTTALTVLPETGSGGTLLRGTPPRGTYPTGTRDRSPAGPTASPAPGLGHPVRIGTAPQPANVLPVPSTSRFTAPMIPEAPVVLRLDRDRDISLQGPGARALHRTILLQAASSDPAGSSLHIVCAGIPAELEPSARFLPGVTLAALPEAGAAALPAAAALLTARLAVLPVPAEPREACLFVLCIHESWARHAHELTAALPEHLRAHISVIRVGGGPAAVTVTVSSGRARRTVGADTQEFLPDLAGCTNFERLSRAVAGRRPAPETADPGPGNTRPVPAEAAFSSYHVSSSDRLLAGWKLRPAGAEAVVGVSAVGPVTLDLEKDGPHFLVAGTTGSGKSEFLRSFIASLAARQPPSAVTVLLIDFKGGSGLGPLASLPHAVGFLTDLSAGNVARALVSLRAEVRRREALFAEAGADTLAAYNMDPGHHGTLPRLLVAVDEFRMLADEVPSALPELLRIAAIGRSLGIHLILATQRPQGAVTGDIRANIATSIALRVSSAAESRDVINSDCASGIPADLPGRAYVARGGGRPLAFQSLSTELRPGSSHPALADLQEYLLAQRQGTTEPPAAAADPDALRAFCDAARGAAARGNYPAPFRPVRPPLPNTLTRDLLDGLAAPAGAARPAGSGIVLLGLLDDPQRQQQRDLAWHPGSDSHLAVIGSHRSGTGACLQLVTAGLLSAQPGRHLYVLDSDGDLAWLAGAEQTGAYVGPQETNRAARVLAYLAAEAAARTVPSAAGTGGTPLAGITLVVSGWARWCTAFRSGRGLAGEEDLADIVRDGERGDICVVVSGERELLNARCFPLFPNRMFFPCDATAETLLLWPRLPAMDRMPGRALVQGRIGTAEGLACQILLPEPLHEPSGLPPGCARPHRVEALPAYVAPECLTAAPDIDSLAVGVCGDELETAAVRVPRGSVFLAAGPRGSGRTSFLRQLERSADPTLLVFRGTRADEYEGNLEAFLTACGQGTESRMLILVDDADLLPASVHRRLAELNSAGARVVLGVVPGPQLTARVPLALQARSAPRGALLCPGSPMDGDIFGIRIDPAGRRPPGRCFLVEGSEVREAQAAYRPEIPPS